MTKASEKYEEKRKVILKLTGEKCRKLREDMKLSQRDLSKTFNINQSIISKFERGELDSLSLYMLYLGLPFGGLEI